MKNGIKRIETVRSQKELLSELKLRFMLLERALGELARAESLGAQDSLIYDRFSIVLKNAQFLVGILEKDPLLVEFLPSDLRSESPFWELHLSPSGLKIRWKSKDGLIRTESWRFSDER